MSSLLNLSLPQQQIWLDQQSYPHSPHFNIGGIGFIDGEVDVALMQQALTQLVAEQAPLRLLPQADGQQLLVDSWPHTLLQVMDFSHEADANLAMRQFWQTAFLQQIELDGVSCPWSMALIKQAPGKYGLMAKFHHLVMDGFAVALTFRLYSEIYNHLHHGAEKPKRNSLSYVEFINESQQYCQSQAYLNSQKFWRQLLPSLPPTLLRAKYQGDKASGLAKANHHIYKVPLDVYEQFEQLAKGHNVTTYHLYIAALAIYFCRMQQRDSIVMGLPVLNRGGKRYKDSLGMFVTVIPISLHVQGQTSVVELLGDIARQLRQSYRHSRFPLSQMVQDLDMIKSGQSRLFDVILSFEIQDFQVAFGDSPLVDTRQYFSPIARYPLAVSVCVFYANAPVEVVLESSSEYFTMAQTVKMGARIAKLMDSMLSAVDKPISALKMISDVEQRALIDGVHQQVNHTAKPISVVEWFEHFAAWQGQNVAIKHQAGQLSYYHLNVQANRCGRYLQSLGVQHHEVVMLLMPRSVEALVAMLAVLKIRATFVIVDVNAPIERIAQIKASSQAQCCLTLASALAPYVDVVEGLKCVLIDEFCASHHYAAHSNWCDDNFAIKPQVDDLAYILYTSGSTGVPKGVQMAHGPLARRMKWVGRAFNYQSDDCWLQTIELTFDPALMEIFAPLTHGASVALPPAGAIAPQDVWFYLEKYAATSVIFVPTTMGLFVDHMIGAKTPYDLSNLRITVCGGELLSTLLAKRFVSLTYCDLYNFYGPTEACIFATVAQYQRHFTGKSVPIGRPVDDTTIYIVETLADGTLQLLPFGEEGEIAIGGMGLAKGYVQDSAKTKAKFVPDSFGRDSERQLYLTGDLGYWDDQGDLYFTGRIDSQIKVRGQRVEVGDIEQAVNSLKAVAMAAVKKVDEQLCCWVVLEPAFAHLAGKSDNYMINKQFQSELKTLLPLSWLPEQFFVIDKMPKQTSGKLDYHQLYPITAQLQQGGPFEPNNEQGARVEIELPRSALEQLIFDCFSEQLTGVGLSIHSDFFAAGGDSLKALSLLSALNRQLNLQLTLASMVKNPSVAALAAFIVNNEQEVLVELNHLVGAKRVYLAVSGHGDLVRLKPLAEALAGLNHQLVILQPPVNSQLSAFDSIEQLGQCYASLIALQPNQGEVVIAGFSVGGNTALETCRHLLKTGVAIKKLLLIDTTYPRWFLRLPLMWRACGFLVTKLRLGELNINRRTLGTLFGDEGLNMQIYALSDYQPQPLGLNTQLIISTGFNRSGRWLFRPWRKVFNQLDEQLLPGFHGTLFDRACVNDLAKLIVTAHK